MLVGSLSFAESEDDDGGFFGRKLTELLKWAPNAIGDGLNGIGPSAEDIYMPGSPYYFSFATNNVFGLFTSKAYPLFKMIAIIMISPLLTFYGIGLMKASSGIGKKTSIDAIATLILSVGVLWFLPDILNFIFGMKDNISQSVNRVFISGDNAGFITEMRQLAEEGGVLDALIYLAAVVFSYWLMANYVGLSFGFAVLLLYTPVALIISSASSMRKTASELNKTFWGYVLTPIFDISLLGIVTITRGVDPSAFGIDPLMYNVMSIVLVMSVIPARSFIKRLFGFGPMFGDMLGVGMIAGVAGMALRGAGSKGKPKSSGSAGYKEHDTEDTSNQDRASYFSNLAEMEKQKQDPGTAVGFYNPANENLPPLKEMTRDDFLQRHQGKSYFNERDIGGLSNQEKADYYESQSKLDELKMRNDRKDRIKSGAANAGKGVLKGGFKGYTSVVGASAGMFMGPAGAAAGGMLGYKLGDKLTSSGDAFKKTAAWGKDVYDESRDVLRESGIASKINFRGFQSDEDFEAFVNEINEQPVEEPVKVYVMEAEEEKQPGITRTRTQQSETEAIREKFDIEMDKTNSDVSNLMHLVKVHVKKDNTNEIINKVAETGDYNKISEMIYNSGAGVQIIGKGADEIYQKFEEENRKITRDLKFDLTDNYYQNGGVIDKAYLTSRLNEAAAKRAKELDRIMSDVSEKTGFDYKAYITEKLSQMN